MEYLLIVHLNRTHTLEYIKVLKRFNVLCSVVETPKSLGLSCGISVKCGVVDKLKAKQALNMTRFSSFEKMYLCTRIGMKVDYKAI